MKDDARSVARSVIQAVKQLREGRLSQPGKKLKAPRPK